MSSTELYNTALCVAQDCSTQHCVQNCTTQNCTTQHCLPQYCTTPYQPQHCLYNPALLSTRELYNTALHLTENCTTQHCIWPPPPKTNGPHPPKQKTKQRKKSSTHHCVCQRTVYHRAVFDKEICNTAPCLSENSLCQRTVQNRTVFAKEMCNTALHMSENSCQRANCTMQSCVCQRSVQHSTPSVRELCLSENSVRELHNTELWLPKKCATQPRVCQRSRQQAPQHAHQRSGKETHTKTMATVSTVQRHPTQGCSQDRTKPTWMYLCMVVSVVGRSYAPMILTAHNLGNGLKRTPGNMGLFSYGAGICWSLMFICYASCWMFHSSALLCHGLMLLSSPFSGSLCHSLMLDAVVSFIRFTVP